MDTQEKVEKVFAQKILVDLLFATMVAKLLLLVSLVGMKAVHYQIIQVYMLAQLTSWIGSNLKW